MIKLTAMVDRQPALWYIKMCEQASGYSWPRAATLKPFYIDKRDDMMPVWIAEANGKIKGRGAATEITFKNDIEATVFLLKWS